MPIFLEPTSEQVSSGEYPIYVYLFVYTFSFINQLYELTSMYNIVMLCSPPLHIFFVVTTDRIPAVTSNW
jgi:hypothetical protein